MMLCTHWLSMEIPEHSIIYIDYIQPTKMDRKLIEIRHLHGYKNLLTKDMRLLKTRLQVFIKIEIMMYKEIWLNPTI